MMKTTKVPKTPKCVKGVMNLRGNIIPVVELRSKIEMPEKEAGMYTAIVIVKIDGTSIGFVVDRVEEVVTMGEDQLSEPPKFGAAVNASYLKKMAQNGKEPIMILDLNSIFADDELAGLENMTK
jgi:purine-binding chemotaxis protein CheW